MLSPMGEKAQAGGRKILTGEKNGEETSQQDKEEQAGVESQQHHDRTFKKHLHANWLKATFMSPVITACGPSGPGTEQPGSSERELPLLYLLAPTRWLFRLLPSPLCPTTLYISHQGWRENIPVSVL